MCEDGCYITQMGGGIIRRIGRRAGAFFRSGRGKSGNTMRRTAITCALTVALALLSTANALANVNVTTATGGTGLSADLATNGAAPAFTTLGNIVIAEGTATDFATGTNRTLILT